MTREEVEAITRPSLRAMIRKYRNFGLADYALSRPFGYSVPSGILYMPVKIQTPVEREHMVTYNMVTLAYLQGYNRNYLG